MMNGKARTRVAIEMRRERTRELAKRVHQLLSEAPLGLRRGEIADAVGVIRTSGALCTALKQLVNAGHVEQRGTVGTRASRWYARTPAAPIVHES
jgi:predicted transcriptional regulator